MRQLKVWLFCDVVAHGAWVLGGTTEDPPLPPCPYVHAIDFGGLGFLVAWGRVSVLFRSGGQGALKFVLKHKGVC